MQVVIRIKGHLDADLWQDWLEGLHIAHEAGGMTRLSGILPDQSALYAVLIKFNRLGVTLCSLESSEREEST